MAAQMMSPHVMMPTTSSTIHDVTHRPVMPSVWLVTPGSPGRKPRSCCWLHPARMTI